MKSKYSISQNKLLTINVIDTMSNSVSILNNVKHHDFSQTGILLNTSISESEGISIIVPIKVNTHNKDKYDEAKYMATLGIDVFN